jgi:hypothetical protein
MVTALPEGAAGVQFVAYLPCMFAPPGLTMSIVAAGTMGSHVMHHGMSPIDQSATPLITAGVIAILFLSLPMLFTRLLVTACRQGIQYGDLATRTGKSSRRNG